MVVSWTIGKSPSAELVNTILDKAICKLKENERPIIHSDQGSVYSSVAYNNLIKDENIE